MPGALTWTVISGAGLLAVGTFSAVAHGPRWLAWGLLPVALVAASVVGAVLSGLALTDAMTASLAVASLVWAVGQWRYDQRRHVALLLERARRAEHEQEQQARLALANERARIARELHDVVAHSLAVMTAQADGARSVLQTSPRAVAEILRTIGDTGRAAVQDMGGILCVLTADEPDPSVEALGPQPGLADLQDLVVSVRTSGLVVSLTRSGQERPLTAGAELAVFRLIQEALTNTLKHSGPGTRVELSLLWSARLLEVRVADNGRGTRTAAHGTGRGLVGMRERMAQLGGSVTSAPGTEGGFLVEACVPLFPVPVAAPEPPR